MHTKSIICGVGVAVLGFPFWFFYRNAIEYASPQGLETLFAFLFLTAQLVLLAILFLFAERMRYVIVPFCLSVLPMVYEFGAHPVVIGALFFAAATVSYAYAKTQQSIKNHIHLKTASSLRSGMSILLTMMSVVLAVGYFFVTSTAPHRITIRDIIPRSFFDAVLDRTPLLGQTLLPGFRKDITVDEYVIGRLQSSGVDTQLLTTSDRERVLQEARAKLFKDMPSAKGDAKLGTVFYNIITVRSEQFLESYRRFMPLAFAIALFFFLRTIAFPYGWIIIFLALGVVKLLTISGLLIRVEEHALTERIHWA